MILPFYTSIIEPSNRASVAKGPGQFLGAQCLENTSQGMIKMHLKYSKWLMNRCLIAAWYQ